MAHVDDILDEYDDLARDVSRSGHAFFCAKLRRWFNFIDKTPELKAIIDKAESSIDFAEWRATGLVEQRGMGHGRIVLPENDLQRLGALAGLFRSLTEDEQAAWRFAHS